VSMQRNHLSEQILANKVKNSTGGAVDIDPQRTSIDIHQIYNVKTQPVANREELFQSDIVLWMVRIIGAQLALCCGLSFCVYFLRRRTRRLSEAKNEIMEVVRDRKGVSRSTLPTLNTYDMDPIHEYPNDSLTGSIVEENLQDVCTPRTTPSSRSVIPFDEDAAMDHELMMLDQEHGIWSHLKRGFSNKRRRVQTIVSDRSYPSIPHDVPRREGRESTVENQPLTGLFGSPTLTFSGPKYMQQNKFRQTGTV